MEINKKKIPKKEEPKPLAKQAQVKERPKLRLAESKPHGNGDIVSNNVKKLEQQKKSINDFIIDQKQSSSADRSSTLETSLSEDAIKVLLL